VEQVTVDAVVLDAKGNPVRGLTRNDFTVLEEGQPQTIASFDLIDRRETERASQEPAAPARLVTNVVPREERGRTFVILFDDLHLTQQNAQQAKAAVAAFLDQGVVEGDQVTLISTSGAAWWSARLNAGREDLLAVVKRLEARRVLDPARERILDYEAVQIFYYHNVLVARRVTDRLERYGTSLQRSYDKAKQESAMELYGRGVIDPYVENLAMETYFKMRARQTTTLEALERAARALSEGRDRKALLLVSEGFVEDPSQPGFKKVVEAARRVNAAIYFIDASGLQTLGAFNSAETSSGPLDSRDHMAALADLSREGEGAASLARDTGGFSIRSSNDFRDGAVKIGRESQTYYLIGYNPGEVPHDGRFRKIEVKLRVAGKYTVRARRGYFAPGPDDAKAAENARGVDLVLQHALDATSFVDAIPLRMMAYVMEDVPPAAARVVLVADADVSKVDFRAEGEQEKATLDTLVVVAQRDSSDVVRTDQKVEIERRKGAGAGPLWYSFMRELSIPAGTHQAKLVVRDAATNRVGTVVIPFRVPPASELRVSTPVLTDTLNNAPGGPVPALITRRAFPSSAQLYCRFDVFGAGRAQDGLPRVRAEHVIRRPDGTLVGRAPATLIEPTSLGALARMVTIPLRGVPPGDYELVIAVKDEVSGRTQQVVEPFSVTPPALAAGPGGPRP
jgi:VWFA-related protein